MTLYAWDSEDRLAELKRGPTETDARTIATYTYDAFGNRAKKVEKTPQGDKITAYLTDATFPVSQVVEEKATLGGRTETARHVWGEGLISRAEGGQKRYYPPTASAAPGR